MWTQLYSQLTAIITLSSNHDEPHLNKRGMRILLYLRTRRNRA